MTDFLPLVRKERERLEAEIAALIVKLDAVKTLIAGYDEVPPPRLALPAPDGTRSHRFEYGAGDVVRAIADLERQGIPARRSTIAEKTGRPYANLAAVLDGLRHRGLIRRAGERGAARYHIVQSGTNGGDAATEEPAPAPPQERDEPRRRFTQHGLIKPDRVTGLPAGHPAIRERRTLFPSTVVDVADSPRLLVSGQNSRKIGDRIVKGEWAGFPVYTLTLEERATCPASCHHWSSCMGNGMPRARRHRHGPGLTEALGEELAALQDKHPRGFAVRLHQLGDFYDVPYVDAWLAFLEAYPALHVWGYTAWAPETPIGAAVKSLRSEAWERFAVRFSSARPAPGGATTIAREPEGPRVAEGIVCPAQTDRASSCGACALCWSPAAKDETIVFLAHGQRFKDGTPAIAVGEQLEAAE